MLSADQGGIAMRHAPLRFAAVSAFATSVSIISGSALGQASGASPSTLVVPSQYTTIQSAIDAAGPADRIQVMAGIYVEQLRIDKDVTIVGAGMDATIIRAPQVLKRNKLRETSIVEIFDGAVVSMSRLTVAGPGYGTCKKGALEAGIRVRARAHLDFSFGAVRDVHDTPLAPCFRSGTGIEVGEVPGPPATLSIDHSEITHYQSAGIVVLGFGSTATVTHNTVTGPGHAGGVATDGIEFPVGSVGTITHNTVSGNVCPVADTTCGPDWFTQYQHAGILAGGWGPGTVVSNNLVFGNQVGLFLSEADRISDNRMVDNEFFGMGLVDGTFLIEGAQIKGGGGGVWVVAQGADTDVELLDVTFTKLTGPEVETLECCGFTATVDFGP
jgi:Right handed beta helix region